MAEQSGCRATVAALAILAVATPTGAAIGALHGIPGACAGGLVLPIGLLLGGLAWGAVSLPWLLLRRATGGLPELAIPRALVGYVGGGVPAAAAGGYLLADAARAGTSMALLTAVLYGLAILPFAAATALAARGAMRDLLAPIADAA